MAGGDNRLFNLLCYAICGGSEDALAGDEDNPGDTLSSIHDVCNELAERDYSCEILKNINGNLCSTYPEKLIIPISERQHWNASRLKEHVFKARLARTRGRFVVPVLLFNDKYVCRSSTLARSPEIYCRRTYGYWMQGEADEESTDGSETRQSEPPGEQQPQSNGGHINNGTIIQKEDEEKSSGKEWLLDEMRNADISLLQYLRVNTIFDLMVEKKKVKFGMNVTSSEKVDRQQRYLKFDLLSVPYPGCEFFDEYRKHDYSAEGLMFDWKQAFVDADLRVPKKILSLCDIAWEDYIKWDLVQLTKNYLLLHLRSLMDENSTGILLHCISGWDRTPLFISLMRLSLWADGLIHENLNAEEMVYFTVAYDWLLFHHRFSDRIANGEEIFYFCFDFLKYIYSDEFSMLSHFLKSESKSHTDMTGTFINGSQCVITGQQGKATQHAGHPEVFEANGFSKSLASDQLGNHGLVNFHDAKNDYHLDSIPSVGNDDSHVQILMQKRTIESDDGSPSLIDVTVSNGVTSVGNGEVENGETAELTVEGSMLQRRSKREEKLSYARKLVIESYQAAIRWHREREQANNSGFAATLFSQLSKTLNLGKR